MVEFSKCPGSARYDYIDWPNTTLIIGSVIWLPLRILCVFSILGAGAVKVTIVRWLLGKEPPKDYPHKDVAPFLEDQSYVYWWLSNTYFKPYARTILWWTGCLCIERKQHKISDYIADYKPYELTNTKPGLTISNHTGLGDMFVFLGVEEVYSFLSNMSVKFIPFVGTICTVIQSVYLKRDKNEGKDISLKFMEERVKHVEHDKTNHPTMMIFPEGSSGNGETLLQFKKGAFIFESPLKMWAVVYHAPLNTSWILTSLVQCTILNMCNPMTTLVQHEFDVFNPQYTIDKKGLTPGDENNWTHIVKDVEYIYEYACRLRQSGNSIREKNTMKERVGIKLKYM